MRQRLLDKKSSFDPVENTATIRRLDHQHEKDEAEEAVFLGWMNWKLSQYPNQAERRQMLHLFDDLADGVALCQLAELLTKKSLRFNKTPAVAMMMSDNCAVAINALKELGCSGVEARNFVNKDLKDNNRLVLGFLWQLVQLEVKNDDVFAWAAGHLKGYPGVPASLDASHFRDGRLLSFLLHKSAPNAVNLNTMELQSPNDRLVQVIRLAKSLLGVPALIRAEAIADESTKVFPFFFSPAFFPICFSLPGKFACCLSACLSLLHQRKCWFHFGS
jgi:hypothetical protein